MHDLFISYSTNDTLVAEAAKHFLESKGVRCWKAPESVIPGRAWEEEIANAIKGAWGMLLIWSSNSQESKQVTRELSLAAYNEKIIIPLRIEQVEPSGTFAYYLTNTHWIDAISASLEEDLERLSTQISSILSVVREGGAACKLGPPYEANLDSSEEKDEKPGPLNILTIKQPEKTSPTAENSNATTTEEYLQHRQDGITANNGAALTGNLYSDQQSDSEDNSLDAPHNAGTLYVAIISIVFLIGFLNLVGGLIDGVWFVFKKGLGY